MNALFELLGGRKNTLVVFSIVALTALAALDKVSIDQFLENLTLLTGIGVGGHALVGAAKGLKKK